MARISSFPCFLRQFFPCSCPPDRNHLKYYTTSSSTSTSTSTSTTLCYSNSKNHNRSISLVVENLTRRCKNRRDFLQIHAHFISSGLFRHPYPASHILKLSTDFANIDHTLSVFQHIKSPDTFCVNTVLKAHPSHLASLFYFRMLAKGGFHPNSFTFPPLLASCADSLSTQAGFICHAHSIKYGVDNVIPVQNSLIHMYTSFNLIKSASQLFDAMSQKDIVSWNSIIQGYAKLGKMDLAHYMFDQMPERNTVSWNIIISGYLNNANPGCGLKLYREMVKTGEGSKETDTTFVTVLTACGRSARLKEGKSVHASLIKNSSSSLIINTALIDMYSKCQRVESARKVFDKMPLRKRNIVCWNSMILGYSIHGRAEDGISLFHEMLLHVYPDEITFVGVLCACARAGLLTDGKEQFTQMSDYNVTPIFAHYWCMANLYFGVGMVEEAEQVLKTMPLEEGSLELSRLLGSCRFRGEVELGERIATRLIELDPENDLCYKFLYNIYGVAGRWEAAAKVKMKMEENKVGRRKSFVGSSLIDLNQIVHEFRVGERLEVGRMLGCLGDSHFCNQID